MSTATEILTVIDADELQHDVGVKKRSIRLVKERDIFPASWYPAVCKQTSARGIDCPFSAFSFRYIPEEVIADDASSSDLSLGVVVAGKSGRCGGVSR